MTKAKVSATQFNMSTAVIDGLDFDSAEAALMSSLLDEMNETDRPDEVIELTHPAGETFGDILSATESVSNPVVAEDDLLDAIASAEAVAAKHALYASQPAPTDDDIQTDVSVDKATAKAAAKAAKAAAAAIKKAEREAAKAAKAAEPKAPKAPKAPSAPRATSITHKPGALLMHKLGSTAREYLSFSLKDVGRMDEATLALVQDEFVEKMNTHDTIADKVKDKITMLLCWMQKGGELNEVLRRTFTVLHSTGELTSGDKGNLQLNLLGKPYSTGTARSQANQMFMALPELQLTVKEKGKMIANPDSVLLPMVYSRLGLV